MLVGTQRCQRVQPFPRGLVVIKLILFLLCLYANLLCDRRIAHDDEVPGLDVRAIGGSAGRTQAVLDHLARDRFVRELGTVRRRRMPA